MVVVELMFERDATLDDELTRQFVLFIVSSLFTPSRGALFLSRQFSSRHAAGDDACELPGNRDARAKKYWVWGGEEPTEIFTVSLKTICRQRLPGKLE